MKKIIRATRELSDKLGIHVDGLYDASEIPVLKHDGYKFTRMLSGRPILDDSPLSIELGMSINPMYDPHFPSEELVNLIYVAFVAEGITVVKSAALVYDEDMRILPDGDTHIAVYTSEKEPPQPLVEIAGHNLTPRIIYGPDGKANKIVDFCLHKQTHIAKSVVGITSKGEYTEWHEDPEHDNWLSAEVVPRQSLLDLDTHNPHYIPALRVLGQDEDTVRAVLAENKHWKAYHITGNKQK